MDKRVFIFFYKKFGGVMRNKRRNMEAAALGLYLYFGAKTTGRHLDDNGAVCIITLTSVLHAFFVVDDVITLQKQKRSIKKYMRDLLPHFLMSIMATMFLTPALTNSKKESDTMFDLSVLYTYFVISLTVMGISRLIVNSIDIFGTDELAADEKKGLEENPEASMPKPKHD
jgi:hypothetical protein